MSTRANGKMTEISQAELSRRHGWSRSYTSKLVGEGKISTLPNGRIDPEQAERELAANTGWTMHGRHGGSLGDEEGRILDLDALGDEDYHKLSDQVVKQFCDAAVAMWKVLAGGFETDPRQRREQATARQLTRKLMLEIIETVFRAGGFRHSKVKR